MLRATGLSLAQLVVRLESSAAAISLWRTSRGKPSLPARGRLLREFGIPLEAWDRVPLVAPPVTSDASDPAGVVLVFPKFQDNRKTAQDDGIPSYGPGATKEQVVALLQRLATLRALQITVSQQIALAAQETRVLELFGRLNGELTTADENRLCETPRWKRIVGTISSALAKYPEAAAEVASVLKELDAA